MRILICDDDMIFIQQFRELVFQEFKQQRYFVEFRWCQNGTEMVNIISSEPIDILFLDIEMPGMDGFMAAEQLNQLRNKPLLIFTTGFDHLVYDSFQYRPFWFLRKGHLSELSQIVKKAIDVLQHERRYYEINSNGEMYRFPITEILYFESDKHYAMLHTQKDCYRFKKKLNEIDMQLRTYHFIRCHASFLVNCRYIKVLRKNTVELTDGTEILISRSRMNETKTAFMQYIRSFHL